LIALARRIGFVPMSAREQLVELLKPVLDFVQDLDPDAADAKARLEEAFPTGSTTLSQIGRALRAGVESGELCDRENGGVRFSRLVKSQGEDLSVDLVHMSSPGPGHKHPNGEVDLCFAVSGEPTFDGDPPGWTVYPRGSWHVPTVAGGVMDIVYFLPGGAIEFGAKPE
jgi:hypothetical protein